MMWRFWWTDFSFENGLDFQHSNYIFYPDGTDSVEIWLTLPPLLDFYWYNS